MKIKIIPCELNYLNDVQDIPRAFAPFIEVVTESDDYLKWSCEFADGVFTCFIESDVWGNATAQLPIPNDDEINYKKITKRFLKNFLYSFLSEKLNQKLPYGSLTGVRPTKLFYELEKTETDVKNYMITQFGVMPERAELIADCVQNQKNFINKEEDKVALFINIPFCPTRCSYCSFISTEIGRVKKEVPKYVECVLNEIKEAKSLIQRKGLTVSSIYVGGGTPPSIGAENLGLILSELSDYNVEFTVEAGRPDLIDSELVEVLKANNVTRVSVNPQTFNEETLKIIGRQHSIDEVYSAFEKVVGKFTVNMDLIAGLPGESYSDFVNSLEKTLQLHPENITVHTLSLKRGSNLTLNGAIKEVDGTVKKMTDYALTRLRNSNYLPYYMYRQKNMADNLENVGFCLSDTQCKYNIDMMEETISVLGIGAGAMSKLICDGNIKRFSNPKGFREYVDRIDSIIQDKNSFWSTDK